MTAAEVATALAKIHETLDELRVATAEAHAARKDLHQEVKKHRDDIRQAIQDEVNRQVHQVAQHVIDEMVDRMGTLIDSLADDWRNKLGLPK